MGKKFFNQREVPVGTSQSGAIPVGIAILLLVSSLLGLAAGYKAVQTPTQTKSKAAGETCENMTSYTKRDCLNPRNGPCTHGQWERSCITGRACPTDPRYGVIKPWLCLNNKWYLMNTEGECWDQCLAPTVPPGQPTQPPPGGNPTQPPPTGEGCFYITVELNYTQDKDFDSWVTFHSKGSSNTVHIQLWRDNAHMAGYDKWAMGGAPFTYWPGGNGTGGRIPAGATVTFKGEVDSCPGTVQNSVSCTTYANGTFSGNGCVQRGGVGGNPPPTLRPATPIPVPSNTPAPTPTTPPNATCGYPTLQCCDPYYTNSTCRVGRPYDDCVCYQGQCQSDFKCPNLPTATPTVPAGVSTATPSPDKNSKFVYFYGTNSTLNGTPIPVGTTITAETLSGKSCGAFTVSTAGNYGLSCISKPDQFVGANPGDAIYFKINGITAVDHGPDSAHWTKNGDRRHNELSAGDEIVRKPDAERVLFYGHASLDGKPVPPNAIIRTYDSKNNIAGLFVIHTTGEYGVIPAYRDDPSTTIDEGLDPGETVSFTINGIPATVSDPSKAKWTKNGDVIKELDLSATTQSGVSIKNKVNDIKNSIVQFVTGNKPAQTPQQQPSSISGKVKVNNSSGSTISYLFVTLHSDKNDKNGLTFTKVTEGGSYTFSDLTPDKTYIVKSWAKTAEGNWYQNEPCSFTKSDYDCTVKPGQTRNLSINIGPQGLRYSLQKSQEVSKNVLTRVESLPVVGPFIQMFIISAF